MTTHDDDAPFEARAQAPQEPLPMPVSAASLAMWVMATLQIAGGVYVVLRRDAIAASLMERQPDLPAAALTGVMYGAVVGGVVLHAVLALLYGGLGIALRQPRRWPQLAATALCLLGVVAGVGWLATGWSLMPATEAGGIPNEQLVTLALRLCVAVLLWVPRSARRFYAAG